MQIFPRSLNKLPLVAGAAATLGLVVTTFLIWYYCMSASLVSTVATAT